LRNFIDLGFEAVIIAAKADLFDKKWVGQKVDLDFTRLLAELKETKGVTPCGEAGEYHTLVIDGPLFVQRLELKETEKVLREGRWFLEIMNADLKAK
ncbi:ATP-binding protein, partial [Chloroflexota bacterium]